MTGLEADRRVVARKLVLGGGFRLGGLVLTRLLTVTRLLVFARIFAPDVIGSAALAVACVTVASSFADFGFYQSVLRTRKTSSEIADTAFTLSLIAAGAVALILLTTAPLLSTLFSADITNYIRFLSFMALTIPLGFPRVFWERSLDYAHPTIAWGLSEFLVLVGALTTELIFDLGVWSILIGYAVATSFSTLYVWTLAASRPCVRLDRGQARALLSFGWPYMLQNVNGQVMAQGDNLLVGKFAGPSQLAYYNFAWNLPTMFGTICSTIDGMLLPLYARFEGSHADLRRLFNRSTKMWSAVASFFGFGTILFTEEIIDLLFGPVWEPVVPILRVMMISFLIRFCTGYPYNNLVLLRGRTKYMMKWGFVNTALVFTLGLLLIRSFGPIGGAWFWVIQAVVLIPLIRFPLISQELHSLEFLRHAWQPPVAGLFAAGFAFLLSETLSGPAPVSVSVGVAAYVAMFFAALLAIDRQLVPDIRRLLSLARAGNVAT
ncbi:MAG: oligosaccharide flippase family protein [Nitrospiraceae bacterium]|nr:oligosaccharide flippase family protein [Nitrospiraceae bacterium]